MSSIANAVNILIKYEIALVYFIFYNKKYSEVPLSNNDRWAKVQIFSLSLIFRLWSKPHYRSPSFKQDMIDNLRNVAIPGTGLPLSIFCYHKIFTLIFIFYFNPLICLYGAMNKARKLCKGNVITFINLTCHFFIAHLLHPQDWFSFWRLNCRLVSYHSLITKSQDYRQEDKWTFLKGI
jgi:hypothetical protein